MKYTAEIKSFIRGEFANPTEPFVKFVAQIVYPGTVTARIREQFAVLLKKSFSEVIGDMINDRLKNAMQQSESVAVADSDAEQTTPAKDEDVLPEPTPEEMECFHTIRAVLRNSCDPKRIIFRQYNKFFAILMDDSIRKPIARLIFRGEKKFIEVFDDYKTSYRYEYNGTEDIYPRVQEMVESVEIYDNKRPPRPEQKPHKGGQKVEIQTDEMPG